MSWMNSNNGNISIQRQCQLAGISRSSYYYQPAGESAFNLKLMKQIDRQYLKRPYYGARRMTVFLQREGYQVNIKRIKRLMGKMGIVAIYPTPKTSKSAKNHEVHPYLLRGTSPTSPRQVWCSDITYIPMRRGFMYLVAVMDWYSRLVLSWQLSNTLTVDFCLEALREALQTSQPDVFNTDQGSQFTSRSFTGRLKKAGIQISMDGRGRALDNAFIERLWRSVKYEHVYLHAEESGAELHQGLSEYFYFYNCERPHQGMGYQTPEEVHREEKKTWKLSTDKS